MKCFVTVYYTATKIGVLELLLLHSLPRTANRASSGSMMGDQKYYGAPNAAPATHVLKQFGKGVRSVCVTLTKPLIPSGGPAKKAKRASKFKLPPRGSYPAPPNYNRGL